MGDGPGPPVAPGGTQDPIRAQECRLGISSGSAPGEGAPSVRRSVARGCDLSGQNPTVHLNLAASRRPKSFVWGRFQI